MGLLPKRLVLKARLIDGMLVLTTELQPELVIHTDQSFIRRDLFKNALD